MIRIEHLTKLYEDTTVLNIARYCQATGPWQIVLLVVLVVLLFGGRKIPIFQ